MAQSQRFRRRKENTNRTSYRSCWSSAQKPLELLVAHLGTIDISAGCPLARPITSALDLGHGCTQPGGLGGPTTSHGVFAKADSRYAHKLQYVLQIFFGVGVAHHLGWMRQVRISRAARRHHRTSPAWTQKLKIPLSQLHGAQVTIGSGIQAPAIHAMIELGKEFQAKKSLRTVTSLSHT